MSRPRRAGNKPRAHAAGHRRPRGIEAGRTPVNVIAPLAPRGKQPAAVDPRLVPEAVRRRFVLVRDTYHLASGARAFVDRGDRLTTRRDSVQVLRSLAEIAHARGWKMISIEGTKRFRRRMTLAAHQAGLSVQGQLSTPRARKDHAPGQPRRRRQAQPAHAPSNATPAADRKQSAATPAPRVPHPSIAREWRGRLIDHGPAPYQRIEANAPSFFVTLEMSAGVRTLWGRDLQRALRASTSGAVRGDEVVLYRMTDQGQAGSERSGEPAFRPHRYVIETRTFIEARADLARVVRDTSVSARDAIRRHPALVGTYLQLRAAQLVAMRLREREDQRQFVGLIRRALIASIARGEPLRALGLRARERTPRAPDAHRD